MGVLARGARANGSHGGAGAGKNVRRALQVRL